jgi:hypothetical protein
MGLVSADAEHRSARTGLWPHRNTSADRDTIELSSFQGSVASMMEMSPSAAVIVVFIVLFTAIAGVFVGMRLVGRRLQDGKPPSSASRTSDTSSDE